MTFKLFYNAGFKIRVDGGSYRPAINDERIDCFLIKAVEIPRLVSSGSLDAGLTGKDLIAETGYYSERVAVKEIADLPYTKTGIGRIGLVIAIPINSSINTPEDLEGKRIATEFPNITNAYLSLIKVNARVDFSFGGTEVKAAFGYDAISERTETGRSLKENGYRILSTITNSTTKLIANKKSISDPWKETKIRELALLLRGALEAETKVGLKMNVNTNNLAGVLSLLPALMSPTISQLYDKDWVAVEVIADKTASNRLIPKLKQAGARGIVEYPLTMLIK